MSDGRKSQGGSLTGSARGRFEEVARAVVRLHDVQLMIMCDCEDWRPPGVSSRKSIPDPTASAAIRHVDELEGKLAALRAEEEELINLIGEALVVVRAVRDVLGGKYADLLEWRYIDCMAWSRIEEDHDVKKRTGLNRLDIAFDWIDSIGMTRILAGDLEI